MRDFEYVAPTSLAEAVQAFAGANGRARAFAGGTDIIDQVRRGVRTPDLLVDLKGVPELTILEYDEATGLRIGAATACVRIKNDPDVQEHYSGIASSAALVGSIQIQNRATMGGNIGNAAPSADTVPVPLAMDATVLVTGPRGQREERLADVFAGPGRLTLQPDEFIVEIRVPPPVERSTTTYLRFIPRAEMDIAVAGVGVNLQLEDGNRVKDVGIALAAVAPTPVRADKAEELLKGEKLTLALVREAGERALETTSPIDDTRGSAEYRRQLVKVLTRRALTAAAERLGVKVE
jgi:carbon-monoxide dehydrogenase medium subunit